jgi:hypothetical protein
MQQKESERKQIETSFRNLVPTAQCIYQREKHLSEKIFEKFSEDTGL